MENQQQSSGNNADTNIDINRSQNREGANDASIDRSGGDSKSMGGHGHHGGSETGSHQEGEYDKDHQVPTTEGNNNS